MKVDGHSSAGPGALLRALGDGVFERPSTYGNIAVRGIRAPDESEILNPGAGRDLCTRVSYYVFLP